MRQFRWYRIQRTLYWLYSFEDAVFIRVLYLCLSRRWNSYNAIELDQTDVTDRTFPRVAVKVPIAAKNRSSSYRDVPAFFSRGFFCLPLCWMFTGTGRWDSAPGCATCRLRAHSTRLSGGKKQTPCVVS